MNKYLNIQCDDSLEEFTFDTNLDTNELEKIIKQIQCNWITFEFNENEINGYEQLKLDKQRLDFIQNCLGKYSDKIVARYSSCNRGFRLHETSREDGVKDVRLAIDNFMQQEFKNNSK